MPLEGANIQIRAPEQRSSSSDLLSSIAKSLGRGAGGGGGGVGATKFDYIFNPATGGYELMPHSNSSEITKYNLAALQQYRAKQAVQNDASIAEKLKDFNTMSAEKMAATLNDIRTQDLPRLQKQTGIPAEQLIAAGLTDAANTLDARSRAIEAQSGLGTFADTFRMGLGSFTDAVADMFSNTEEQLSRAERRAEANQRIIERNPYLENRERQRAEGAGALDLLGTGGLHEAGALLGEFAGASGGPLALAGGGAGIATRAATRFLPSALSQAARATALQRYGYAGAAVGGAIGGAPAQQAAVTTAIANDPTLTREEKLAALEKANTPARLIGAGTGGLVLPVGAMFNRTLSSLRAQAGRGGSNVAQAVRARNAANGEIPAGQPSTYWQDVINNARVRDIAAENARLTAPGMRGRLNRYRASLPDSMLESTAFGVGLNTATNTIVGEATGRDYDPFANTTEAAVSSALFGPLFNVMNSRPVRAVPTERLDARGNVITYGRAPDGSIITSAGIRQIGEDPTLPNYSYLDTQSPWPPRTPRDLAESAAAAAREEAAAANEARAASVANDRRARETNSSLPDEFALRSWWPTEQVEAQSSPVVATPTGLSGSLRTVPSVVNAGQQPLGNTTPIHGVQQSPRVPVVGSEGGEATSRKIGGGRNVLKSKTDGIAKDSPIYPYFKYLYKDVFTENPGLNRPVNREIRERWAADYARYDVPAELRQPLYDALDNVLYNSTNASLRNYFNNSQINMMARAHESLARVIGEQNAQNSATAGEGSQSGGTGEPAASMGGSDVQGTGRAPDANIPADSGEPTNAAGTPEVAPEQLSGGLVDGGTPAQERGNVVATPQDTGAPATPEGTVGTAAEPAIRADGESGAGPATTPDAEGSPSAGSAEPAAGARTGDDGNVANASGDAESGVAPQPERVVNSADLDTLIEDAATAGGTVAHAEETYAAPDAPTDSEIIASATTRTEPPTESAPVVAQHPQTLEEKAAVYERGTSSGGKRSRGTKSRLSKYDNPERHTLDLPTSTQARRIHEAVNDLVDPTLESDVSRAELEEWGPIFPIRRASIEALMNPDRRTFETNDFLAAANWALHTRPELADELYHALLKRVETDPNTAMFVRDDEGVALNNDANREWAAFNRLYDLVRDTQTVDETPPVSLGAYRQELAEAAAGNDVSASTRRPAEDSASAADLRGSEAEVNPSDVETSSVGSARDVDDIAAYDAIPNKKTRSQVSGKDKALISDQENILIDLVTGRDLDERQRAFIRDNPDKLLRSPIGTIAETRALLNDLESIYIDLTPSHIAGASGKLEHFILRGRIDDIRPLKEESDAEYNRKRRNGYITNRERNDNIIAHRRYEVNKVLEQHGLKLKDDGYTIAPRSNKTRTKAPAPAEPTPAPKASAAENTVTRMTRSEVPFETDAEINTTAGIMQSRNDVLSDRFAPKNINAKKSAKKNIEYWLEFADNAQKYAGGMTLDEARVRVGSSVSSDKFNKRAAAIVNILYPKTETPAKLRAQYDTLKWLEAIAMQNNHTSRLRNFSDGEWRMLSDAYRDLYDKFRKLNDPNMPVVDRGDDVWLDDFLAAGSDKRGVGELHNPYDKLPTSDDAQNVEGALAFARLMDGPFTKDDTWARHTQQILFSRSLENISTRADLLHTLVSRAALTTKETFEKLFTPEQRNAMNEAYQNLRKRVQLLPDNAPENLESWQGRWLGSGGPEYRANTPEARAILFPRAETVDRPSGSVFHDGVSEPGTAGAALDTMPDSAVRHFISRMGMYPADRTAPISSIRDTFDIQDMSLFHNLKGLDNDAAMRLLEKEAMFNYLGEGYEQLTPKEQNQVGILHHNGVPYLRSELDAATIHDQVREIEAVTGEKMDFDTFYRNFLDPEDPAGPTRLAQDKFRTEC